jgi:16S rRNA (uracil1498-N3)-methyltransferase
VWFPADIVHQLYHVLRLKPTETVMVLNNLGYEYQVELEQVEEKEAAGKIVKRNAVTTEPHAWITLYLCLSQREKFEWMLQKCTEVGATCLIPVISSRSLVRESKGVNHKIDRWQKIVKEAAEQSHRGRLPELRGVMSFEEACVHTTQFNQRSLIAWEEESANMPRKSISQALSGLSKRVFKGNDYPSLGLIIGPEGGFSEEEVTLASQQGILPVNLGKRILRMETAAIVATALLLNELGEI